MQRKKIWDISTSIKSYIEKLLEYNLNNSEVVILGDGEKYILGTISKKIGDRYVSETAISQMIRSLMFLGIITPAKPVKKTNDIFVENQSFKIINFISEDDIFELTVSKVENELVNMIDTINDYDEYYSQDSNNNDENNEHKNDMNEQAFWNSLAFSIIKKIDERYDVNIDYLITTDKDRNDVLKHYEYVADNYCKKISSETKKKVKKLFDTYTLPYQIARNKNKSIVEYNQNNLYENYCFKFSTEKYSIYSFLNEFINYEKGKKLVIPIYQRTYRWDEKKLTTLLDDIFKIDENSFHSIGTILLKSKIGGFSVIDGQQRITTVLLILKSLYDIARYNGWKIPSILDDLFKQNENGYNRIYKSFLKIEGNEDFISSKAIFNSDNEMITERKTQLSIVYFASISILSKKITSQNQFWIYISKLLYKLVIVANVYEEDINEYFLFEKLNTQSTPLNVLELLKNNILSRYSLLDESNEKRLQQYFEDKVFKLFTNNKGVLNDTMISKYIMVLSRMYKTSKTKKDSEYQIYKDVIENIYYNQIEKTKLVNDDLKIKEYENIIDLISEDVELYVNVSEIGQYSSSDNPLHPFADYLFSFSKRESYYPFIMKILKEWKNNWSSKINSERIKKINEFRRILHALETYEVRFKFVSNTGQSLGKEMENLLDFDKLPTPIELFNKFKNIDPSASYHLPSIDKFSETIAEKPIIKNKDATILCNRIENYLSNKGIDFSSEENIKIIKRNSKAISVSREHFMPQNPTEWKLENTPEYQDQVNLIGNSLIISTIKNSELSNQSYDNKISKLEKNDVVTSTYLFKGCVIIGNNSSHKDDAIKKSKDENVDLICLEDKIDNYIFLKPIKHNNQFDFELIKSRTDSISKIARIIWKNLHDPK